MLNWYWYAKKESNNRTKYWVLVKDLVFRSISGIRKILSIGISFGNGRAPVTDKTAVHQLVHTWLPNPFSTSQDSNAMLMLTPLSRLGRTWLMGLVGCGCSRCVRSGSEPVFARPMRPPPPGPPPDPTLLQWNCWWCAPACSRRDPLLLLLLVPGMAMLGERWWCPLLSRVAPIRSQDAYLYCWDFFSFTEEVRQQSPNAHI